MKPKKSFRFISRSGILEQMGCFAHAFNKFQLKLGFMQNFSTYPETKKRGQKSLWGNTLTGLGLGTTGALLTKGTSLVGFGRLGILGLFTRGGNLGEGARGANLALGARGALGARENEAND